MYRSSRHGWPAAKPASADGPMNADTGRFLLVTATMCVADCSLWCSVASNGNASWGAGTAVHWPDGNTGSRDGGFGTGSP